jgi:hypothetical protein
MAKKPSKQLNTHSAYRAFVRYSNIAFFLIISLLLAGAATLLIIVVTEQGQPNTDATAINTSFDKDTIEKIRTLSTKGNGNAVPSYGRTNPFVE